MDASLGVGGRARGVGDTGGTAGVDAQRAVERWVVQEVAEGHGPAGDGGRRERWGVAGDDDGQLEIGQAGAKVVERTEVVEVSEPIDRDQGPGARLAQDVAHLLAPVEVDD